MTKPVPILPIDIETAPMESFHWDKKPNFIPSSMNEQETTIICAAWRRPGRKKVETVSVADFNNRLTYKSVRKDKGVTKVLVDLLREAAENNWIVVYQNGDRFDLRKIKARAVIHRLPPIPKLITVDTMKKSNQLGLDYHNLDYMDKVFHGEGKVETRGWNMWKDIVARDRTHEERLYALNEMLEYNDGDIESLERVYRTLAPYVTGLPNANFWQKTTKCCPNPECGSTNIIYRAKPQLATTYAYRRMSCNDCGHWFRETKSIPEYRALVRG